MSSKFYLCPTCDGDGSVYTGHVDYVCCGDVLLSGECCAAVWGGQNLVPVEVTAPCPDCRGSGEMQVSE